MFPLHTWLPDAHVEAPTGGSVILAGVLLKMGTYGFLRFALPLFPTRGARRRRRSSLALAVIGIIYGALVALVQPDMKKLVAYSSVSHLGFVMLGIFAFNVDGHPGRRSSRCSTTASRPARSSSWSASSTSAATRARSPTSAASGRSMPRLRGLLPRGRCSSSVGLPGLNGFVGEFLILLGAFGARSARRRARVDRRRPRRCLHALDVPARDLRPGHATRRTATLDDLTAREIVVLAPLVVLIVWIGIYPAPFLAHRAVGAGRSWRRIERDNRRARDAVDARATTDAVTQARRDCGRWRFPRSTCARCPSLLVVGARVRSSSCCDLFGLVSTTTRRSAGSSIVGSAVSRASATARPLRAARRATFAAPSRSTATRSSSTSVPRLAGGRCVCSCRSSYLDGDRRARGRVLRARRSSRRPA